MTTVVTPGKKSTTRIIKSNMHQKSENVNHQCIMTEKTCTIRAVIPEDAINHIISFIPKCKECETYGFEFKEGYLCIKCQDKRLMEFLNLYF